MSHRIAILYHPLEFVIYSKGRYQFCLSKRRV